MNKQLFDLYRNSERGKNVIQFFKVDETTDLVSDLEGLLIKARDWKCDISVEHLFQWMDLFDANFSNKGIYEGELNRESFDNFIDNYEIIEHYFEEDGTLKFYNDTNAIIISKDAYRNKATLIPFLSIYLFFLNDGFFKPILLPTRHDIFEHNCEALGIELPPIPHTNKHREYCSYYYDVCEAIDAFQEKNELSDEEMCACIYDFALLLQTEPITKELPEPTNVWLTGASGDDFKFLDALGKPDKDINPNQIWACNERTRRGDIVVVSCLSPRSYIHSIWRANSSGIVNPFDRYHSRTTLCDGIIIPPIPTKEMKADTYFANIPIVRKNFQGINGWELTARDYSELMRIIKDKGEDVSKLPHLFDGSSVDFGNLVLEHDVEENILIPALKKLGYKDSDWTRQLSLKAGRKEKAIPDFVFFAQGEHHFEHAPMIIEAKFDMSSMTEMQNAFRQGLSYARMLRSSIMGICDKERIVIYQVDNNGSADRNNPLYENHWAKIFSEETEGAKLKQIIGREIVASL